MYQTILIPTDGSKPSQEAEEHGLNLASKMGSSVTALHIVEAAFAPQPLSGAPPVVVEEQIEALQKAGKEIVKRVKEEGTKKGVTVTTEVVVGHAAHEIVERAKGVDLIVMGTLGRSGLSHLLLGSVAEKVVRHAPCPVLVIRGHKEKK